MLDLNAVMILFKPVNERSDEQEETGSVHKTRSSMLIFGNIVVAWGKADVGVVGMLVQMYHVAFSISHTSNEAHFVIECFLVEVSLPCTLQLNQRL